MAASSTFCSMSFSNIALLSARCTGFAKVKGQNDYAFIIDLEWSDDRSMSIKRTYTEFSNFHGNLIKLFPELKQSIKSKLKLQTSLKENMTSLFAKDKRGLAESREPMLDFYLVNLLKQPERIRMSNIVLSFFEPTEADPKPCKSSSPQEKSDSGIDLTNDTRPSDSISKLSNNNSIDNSRVAPPTEWRDGYGSASDADDDYEGDTSGTETDNDPFDEDYFLDVGFGDLMLQSNENLDPDSSTWCSNTNKFSNILNTLPSTDNSAASRQYKAMTSMCASDDESYADILDINELRESSDTESQMVSADHLSEGLESDDEFMCKPVAHTDMNHYYLSTHNIDNMPEC